MTTPTATATATPADVPAAVADGARRGSGVVPLLAFLIVAALFVGPALVLYSELAAQGAEKTRERLRDQVRVLAVAQSAWQARHPGQPGTTDLAALSAIGYRALSSAAQHQPVSVLVALNPDRGGHCLQAHTEHHRGGEPEHRVVFDSVLGEFLADDLAAVSAGSRAVPTTGPDGVAGACGAGRGEWVPVG